MANDFEFIDLVLDNNAPFVRKICIFGPPGEGKTSLAAQAQDVPEMSNVLLLDCGNGSSTLKSRGDIKALNTRDPIALQKVLWAVATKHAQFSGFKTIIVDDLTALANKVWEDLTKSKDKISFTEHNKLASTMLQVLHLIRDLPVTVIVTCWAKAQYPKKPGTDQADMTQEPTDLIPDIPKPCRNPLMGGMDDVWYIAKDDAGGVNADRYLYTDKVKNVNAKMRDPAITSKFVSDFGGKILPIIKNPNMVDLFARYRSAFAPSK